MEKGFKQALEMGSFVQKRECEGPAKEISDVTDGEADAPGGPKGIAQMASFCKTGKWVRLCKTTASGFSLTRAGWRVGCPNLFVPKHSLQTAGDFRPRSRRGPDCKFSYYTLGSGTPRFGRRVCQSVAF
jgi:hypothetical protein